MAWLSDAHAAWTSFADQRNSLLSRSMRWRMTESLRATATVARWKRVIGDGLRFQTDARQATEVAIATNVLNRMLDLGRPEYVRTA